MDEQNSGSAIVYLLAAVAIVVPCVLVAGLGAR